MLKTCHCPCPPCGLHQPRRNNYFDGKLLVARDFTDEQDYHRGHRQLHNALLHGTGTVCGLKLVEHPSETCRREFVVVEPGMALDCCGQEIIVPERALVRIADQVKRDPDLQAALDGSAHLFIALKRCDAGAEPMPVFLPGCGTGDGGEFGRIAEGFDIELFAAKPETLTDDRSPEDPKLEWVHSFSYDGSVPKAVELNDGEALVQIGVEDGSGARVMVYDAQTHDLTALLGGAKTLSDTVASREARLVFAAGSDFLGGETGIGIWRASGLGTASAPVRVIPLKTPVARLTVSPSSGTLYVLEISGTSSRLSSYSQEVIATYLESGDPASLLDQPSLVFDHSFGDASQGPQRGASTLEITRDGRFLAISSPVGAASERLYLIDTAKFREGSVTLTEARAKGFAPLATARIDAVKWSYDDQYLYVVSRESASSQTILLDRYLLIDGEARLEKAGRGIKLLGNAYDIALAPTESRAYLLMADEVTEAGGGITRLTTVPLDAVKSRDAGAASVIGLSPDAIRLDGKGRSLTLSSNGTRLFAATAASDETRPPHGLVAVIDIAEEDCGVHFLEAVEGCAGCDGAEHRVILGHVAGYVWPGADKDLPVIRDPVSKGASDLALDNFSYRQIVPSAQTLKQVVECILEQGVAEGPPGPHGDPGATGPTGANGVNGTNGANGKSVSAVTVAMLPHGAAPTATVADNGPGLTLNLSLPHGATGPQGGAGAGLAPGNSIIALSWKHAQPHEAGSLGKFIDVLRDKGIALAFEKPVVWESFTGHRGTGPSMLIELQVPAFGTGGIVWASVRALAHPIKIQSISGDLLEDWATLDEADLSEGVCLKLEENGVFPREFEPRLGFRVSLYCDFVVTTEGVALDGNFIGGRLPTGASGGGDTFRSWFFIQER